MTQDLASFLRDWYQLLRQYEGSSDQTVQYALKLHGPLLDEVEEMAIAKEAKFRSLKLIE